MEWCSSQTWLSRVQLKRRFSPSLHNPHCHHHHQLVQDPQYRFNPQQCLRLCSLLPPHPLPHCQTQVTDMFQLCKPWSGENPGVLVSSTTMYHHHGRFSWTLKKCSFLVRWRLCWATLRQQFNITSPTRGRIGAKTKCTVLQIVKNLFHKTRCFTDSKKHRKNCECCPGHYLSTSVY